LLNDIDRGSRCYGYPLDIVVDRRRRGPWRISKAGLQADKGFLGNGIHARYTVFLDRRGRDPWGMKGP